MKFSKRLFAVLLAAVLLFSAVPVQKAQAKGTILYGIGFTTGFDLRLRQQPSTDSKILAVSPKNEVVVVIGKVGDWYHVIYNLTEGYMHKNYVSVQTTQNAELGYGEINGTDVNMRTGPGTNYSAVTQGNTGDKVYILGISGGWFKVIAGERICYVRSDFVDLTEIPYENEKSENDPLFFVGGKSTGLTPSADALKSRDEAAEPEEPSAPTEPEATEPEATEPEVTEPSHPAEDPKDETAPQEPAMEDDGLVDGIGFVKATNLILRSGPSTTASVLGSAPTNDVVVILHKEGDWYKVVHNLKTGYMHGDYLNVYTTGHSELGYGKITGYGVNLRSGAGTDHDVVTTGTKGDTAYILGVENGWYRVIFKEEICYIRSDFMSLTQYPYENQASPNSPLFYRGNESTGKEPSAEALYGSTGNKGEDGGSTGFNVTGQQVVDFAKKFLGIPYRWGGTTPAGFDCSGFVYYIYNSLGYKMPRMIVDMNKQGSYVSKANLQPGDVIIFQNTYASGLSHVGIYVGDGKFIHSPNSRSVVSYADLYSTYYTNHYYSARRICGS